MTLKPDKLKFGTYPGDRYAVYSNGVAIFIHSDPDIARRRLCFLKSIRRQEWHARALWCETHPALAAKIIAAALAFDRSGS